MGKSRSLSPHPTPRHCDAKRIAISLRLRASTRLDLLSVLSLYPFYPVTNRGGDNPSPRIRSRAARHDSRGEATSASWNVTVRARLGHRNQPARVVVDKMLLEDYWGIILPVSAKSDRLWEDGKTWPQRMNERIEA